MSQSQTTYPQGVHK